MSATDSFPLLQLLLHLSFAGILVLALIGLLSVVSLGVLFQKIQQFRAVGAADKAMMNQLGQASSFEDVSRAVSKGESEGMRVVLRWGVAEAAIIPPGHPESTMMIQEALESGMELERTRLEERMTLLVVTSTVGPFLGLLGTVWGIMDAFFAIGKMGSASLSVVAPGIAEALLTTLAGLLVAIPAAAGHQLLSARIRRLESDWLVGASRLLSLHRRTLG
jgi:biopolymer transport protein TolQ